MHREAHKAALFEGLDSADGAARESREGNAWAWVKTAGWFLLPQSTKALLTCPAVICWPHTLRWVTHTSSLTLRQWLWREGDPGDSISNSHWLTLLSHLIAIQCSYQHCTDKAKRFLQQKQQCVKSPVKFPKCYALKLQQSVMGI